MGWNRIRPRRNDLGGEFLLTTDISYRRAAAFRSFQLPGGEKAIKEPRRTALGVLFEMFGQDVLSRNDLLPVREFSGKELALLSTMIKNRVNSPRTTSAGRLFDAVASIIGLRQIMRHEGQAAMELEYLTAENNHLSRVGKYQFAIRSQPLPLNSEINNGALFNSGSRLEENKEEPLLIVDWSDMIGEIIDDTAHKIPLADIASRFHHTLTEIIVDVAKRIGQPRVALSGGCFQNRYLTERTVERLTEEGFHPYWHQRVPPNDGGIALGQIYAAVRK